MDKKSFIRGFGTGVLFVAVILGISCLIRTSDSAVISRARKLGMTFSTSGNKSVLDTKVPATGSSVSGGNDASQVAKMQISRITILKIHQKHHLRLQKRAVIQTSLKVKRKS